MYNLRNIRDLLSEGFSKEEIIELCFYEPHLKKDRFVSTQTCCLRNFYAVYL